MNVDKAVLVVGSDGAESGWSGRGFPSPHLMPVVNRPLVRHALDGLSAGGIREVVVVCPAAGVRALRSAIDGDHGDPRVRYVTDEQAHDMLGCLHAAMDFLDGAAFVVQRADVLLGGHMTRLREQFAEEHLDALVLPLRRHGADDPLGEAGACLLSARALAVLPRPATLEPRLVDLLARIREHGGRVVVEQVDGCHRPRDAVEAVLDANRRLLDRVRAPERHDDHPESDVRGRVIIHPTALLERSVVHGPAIIGAGSRLVHAYVGPYTSIGQNVVVEGAELQDSILLDGAELHHLERRVESSIVGRGARAVRHFAVPRSTRLLIGSGAEVSFS